MSLAYWNAPPSQEFKSENRVINSNIKKKKKSKYCFSMELTLFTQSRSKHWVEKMDFFFFVCLIYWKTKWINKLAKTMANIKFVDLSAYRVQPHKKKKRGLEHIYAYYFFSKITSSRFQLSQKKKKSVSFCCCCFYPLLSVPYMHRSTEPIDHMRIEPLGNFYNGGKRLVISVYIQVTSNFIFSN